MSIPPFLLKGWEKRESPKVSTDPQGKPKGQG